MIVAALRLCSSCVSGPRGSPPLHFLKRGAIPADEAISIAKRIAEGLLVPADGAAAGLPPITIRTNWRLEANR